MMMVVVGVKGAAAAQEVVVEECNVDFCVRAKKGRKQGHGSKEGWKEGGQEGRQDIVAGTHRLLVAKR